jgi:hypothetical protein
MKTIMLRRMPLLGCVATVILLVSPSSLRAADFVVITKQVNVNRPAADVWKRIGDYCAIAEWLKVTCDLTSGRGDIGTVRRLNSTTVELMVGKSAHSYTYWQTVGNMAPTSYHGTLSVEAVDASTSRLTYVLLYDQAALASDALRASEHERLSTRFQGALDTMKGLVEAK